MQKVYLMQYGKKVIFCWIFIPFYVRDSYKHENNLCGIQWRRRFTPKRNMLCYLKYSIFSTCVFIGCLNFTNIACGDYCFELRSFNIIRQLNAEMLTNSVEAFCLENKNFRSAPWSIPYVAMPTRIKVFWCILTLVPLKPHMPCLC